MNKFIVLSVEIKYFNLKHRYFYKKIFKLCQIKLDNISIKYAIV